MWMALDSYLSLPWMILDVVIRDKNAGDHPSHRYPPRRAAVLGGRLPSQPTAFFCIQPRPLLSSADSRRRIDIDTMTP